ncbi:MAG: hypothetical protein KHZ72_04170 [Lachnospiraceae bacterium]|nr:hypothetical protein [Lachnospiraceae bacterium]
MKVYYIKDESINENILRMFLKDDVCMERLHPEEIEMMEEGAVLVISDQRKENFQKDASVIVWEELFLHLYKYVRELYLKNFDYYYLCYNMEKAKRTDITNLIIGSSYARFGMKEAFFNEKTVNLSLVSQDFYYAVKIADEILETNRNVRNIIIGCGYYSFNSDLSRTKSNELNRISNVYYPIFHDMHHAVVLPPATSKMKSELLDMERIEQIISKDLLGQRGEAYFLNADMQENAKLCTWERTSACWRDLTEEEKYKGAMQRTATHNKIRNRETTFQENQKILQAFIKRCNECKIEVWVVVLPFTKAYLQQLDQAVYRQFIEGLDQIDGMFHSIDFNETDLFTDDDFIDSDHLAESGAYKVSVLMEEILERK